MPTIIQRLLLYVKVFIVWMAILVPINEIIQLKNKYNAMLIVDEAHSIGLYGKGEAVG